MTTAQVIENINMLRESNILRKKQGFTNAQELVNYGIEYAKKFSELMLKLEKSCKN